MAKRENHDKRTDLYAKAVNNRDKYYADIDPVLQGRTIQDVMNFRGSGTFVVPYHREKISGDNWNMIGSGEGTKWLPPEER